MSIKLKDEHVARIDALLDEKRKTITETYNRDIEQLAMSKSRIIHSIEKEIETVVTAIRKQLFYEGVADGISYHQTTFGFGCLTENDVANIIKTACHLSVNVTVKLRASQDCWHVYVDIEESPNTKQMRQDQRELKEYNELLRQQEVIRKKLQNKSQLKN